MSTQEIKIVTVLNKQIEIGRAINASVHSMFGLHSKMATQTQEAKLWADFREFNDADGNVHDCVSGRSLIVLKAKSQELRKFRRNLIEAGILYTAFHNCMTEGSTMEQVVRSNATREEDLVYYAISVIGVKEEVDKLTKRFSLFK